MIKHRREDNNEQLDDALFANNMIQQVCGNVIPKLVSHIGRSEDNKKKSIKVVLHNEQDKEKILNNLRNLEGNTE